MALNIAQIEAGEHTHAAFAAIVRRAEEARGVVERHQHVPVDERQRREQREDAMAAAVRAAAGPLIAAALWQLSVSGALELTEWQRKALAELALTHDIDDLTTITALRAGG